jgi:ubiquinone/menaquinone biosynthesis C-methylase UbiE
MFTAFAVDYSRVILIFLIMSKDNKSIHDFDFSLICEYYASIERQGPGSPEATRKALSFVNNLNEKSLIADMGCGTGGQTMELARNTPGSITGIDLFPDFIELFNQQAIRLNFQHRVTGEVGSMDQLRFNRNELDLIWSEGAIYNIGFERGLNEWRNYLKPGGYIAVTEISWFTDERPDEITDFWKDAYAETDTIPNKMAVMQKAGYIPVASFILPEYCWTENFYKPQIQAQELFLSRHKGNHTAEELVANQRHEAELYNRFKDWYGYVFYIGKKI